LNYQMGFETLGIMAGLGLAWEFVYNWLQRFRWDDDWPPFFMLIQIVPEAVLLWYVSHLMGVFPQGPLGFSSPEMLMYVLHVSTLWVVIWLFLLGPMRVLAPWWRFESGVLIRPNPGTARYRKSSPAWQEILAGKGALVPSSSEIGEKS
ncbi:MAG TPA: hypothetical protein VMU77_04960, partial [Acidimicrobiales bacterium]|nr:hypothetical protein [Acidimicrobiales bacterium]